MITDVIDDSEIKNGVREEVSVYVLYSSARKLGQAVAAGLAGWLLEGIVYNNYAIALLFWYSLHKNQVEQNHAIGKATREA